MTLFSITALSFKQDRSDRLVGNLGSVPPTVRVMPQYIQIATGAFSCPRLKICRGLAQGKMEDSSATLC